MGGISLGIPLAYTHHLVVIASLDCYLVTDSAQRIIQPSDESVT